MVLNNGKFQNLVQLKLLNFQNLFPSIITIIKRVEYIPLSRIISLLQPSKFWTALNFIIALTFNDEISTI
jgi:hypothetical protein